MELDGRGWKYLLLCLWRREEKRWISSRTRKRPLEGKVVRNQAQKTGIDGLWLRI